jgi:hypothetical protein
MGMRIRYKYLGTYGVIDGHEMHVVADSEWIPTAGG